MFGFVVLTIIILNNYLVENSLGSGRIRILKPNYVDLICVKFASNPRIHGNTFVYQKGVYGSVSSDLW